MKDIEIIKTIDYILKKFDYKYKEDKSITFDSSYDESIKIEILVKFSDKGICNITQKSEDLYYEDEYR